MTNVLVDRDRTAHGKKPHLQRQQEIVDAARKIITDHGIEHLTLHTLAEQVSLSEAAIYRHVEDKQDILLLVLEDIEDSLVQAVTQAKYSNRSHLERLKRVLKAHLSYSERRRGVSLLVLNEALRLEDKTLRRRAAQVIEGYLDTIREILREGQETGEVSVDLDIEVAARLFWGMVQGNVTLWALNSRSFPLAAGYEAMWKVYRRAVEEGRRSVVAHET